MSYNIYAGSKVLHFSWNYNEKIIFPILGEEGLRQFNNKPCREVADVIARLLDRMNDELRRLRIKSLTIRRTDSCLPYVEDFFSKYGDGPHGHALEGIFRLTEVMIECYRHPDELFEIN